MAILQRVQWTLFQLGLVKTWAQVLFVALSLLLALWGLLHQSGMDAVAKSSTDGTLLPLLNGKSEQAPEWNTLYEPKMLVPMRQSDQLQAWATLWALQTQVRARLKNLQKTLRHCFCRPINC
mgnify:CR=1 FL=1